MKIIIQTHFIKDGNREIYLINGDIIKFISSNSNTVDGLGADIAIGPDADVITCRSIYVKRIWSFEDLENHIKNI